MIGGRKISGVGALMVAVALQLCGGAAQAAADPVAGKLVFSQCGICHSTAKSATGIGPTLAGAYGRKAGSVPGFAYSSAMKANAAVWNDATLDAFLTSPQKAVPGNRMPFPGQPDAVKRANLIAYLKTLK